MLKLYGHADSINVRKVLWACDEVGQDYVREDWGGAYRSTHEQAFRALNPVGLVPVIEDGGKVLRESNTIVRYLAAKHRRTDLLPDDPAARATVELWMDWQATEFNNAWRGAFMGLVRKHPDYADPDVIRASQREWAAMMEVLESQLRQTGTFAAGPGFTVADIPIGLSVNRWFMTPMERPALPAVSAYYDLLSQRAPFRTHGRNGRP